MSTGRAGCSLIGTIVVIYEAICAITQGTAGQLVQGLDADADRDNKQAIGNQSKDTHTTDIS